MSHQRTCPARPKIPMAPSAFPFLGAHQAPGNKPNPPKGVKAWGDGLLRPEDLSSAEPHPAEPPRGTTAYRMQPSKWRGKATHKRPRASAGTSVIHRCVPPTHEYGTRPFLRWVQSQGPSPHATGKAKNTFGPSVKAWGMVHWGWRTSPVPKHTRQNHPEVKRPTECDPTTGEERSHTP